MTTPASGSYDFIIVGGGIAGLRAASALAPVGRVLILTKADAAESNTGYAQGGIAAAMGPGDSLDLHIEDTLKAGAGLCDEDAVRVLVDEGPRRVQELIDWGARFDRSSDGSLIFGLEAAHSARRILHAGDATGREISRAMWQRVAGLPNVETVSHAFVTDILVDAGTVSGIRFYDEAARRRTVRANRVLLATGGAGQVFRETTNPAVATGDGIALAYRAGARVADLEFVQFHPTALSVPGAPRFLLSEALRGEGAKLVNARGEPFMERYDRAADLAPRDVVARAIVREMEVTDGPVYLTLQHLNAERVRARFPTITAMCSRAGLDVACDRIPVGPAAHYMMGGIDTDVWGRTSIAGLFAAGETACTGVHGANRLASNSLLEGLVFGARAAEAMQQTAQAATTRPDRIPAADLASHDSSTGTPAAAAFSGSFAIDEIRDLMWRAAGLFRTRHRLAPAVEALSQAFSSARESAMTTADGDIEPWRCFNLATVALLVARAALRREESRGGHYRADFPARDDLHWKVHVTEEIDRGVRL